MIPACPVNSVSFRTIQKQYMVILLQLYDLQEYMGSAYNIIHIHKLTYII